MLTKRIIPCLDIRDGRVVKGVQFLNIRDAGDPVEAAVRYNEAGADELVLLDINASHEGRGTMLDVVSRVAEQVFIPFTVGGGIGSVEDAARLLDAYMKAYPRKRQFPIQKKIVQALEKAARG